MKTNFITNLKQFLFLFIAIIGTFFSYGQPSQTPTIGGSKTPDTGGFFDIGGREEPPTTPLTSLTVRTQCTFAFFNEPGGGKGTSSDTGQVNDPDDIDDDTGGRGTNTGTGEYSTVDIGGGKNSTGGLEDTCPICPDTGGGNGGKSTTGEFAYSEIGGRGTSSDTGQVDPSYDFDDFDTGGEITGRPENVADIGGRDSTGGLRTTMPDYDTGGRGDTGTGMFNDGYFEYEPGIGCHFETGGRNGVGTSTGGDYDDDTDNDTGGRGSKGTTGELPESYAWLSALN